MGIGSGTKAGGISVDSPRSSFLIQLTCRASDRIVSSLSHGSLFHQDRLVSIEEPLR